MAISDRLRNAWNAFIGSSPVSDLYSGLGSEGLSNYSYSTTSPSRPRSRYANDRSIVSSVYNRLAIDLSEVQFRHIKLDDNSTVSRRRTK